MLFRSLGLSSHQANIITGVYFAYNFALHLLSGYLAGRLFSYRSLIATGLVFQMIGCFVLVLDNLTSLYWGLSCMLVGTGTMVTCINMLVSQLYSHDDPQRESGFLINYSAMNIGFVLGFSLAGFFQLNQDFNRLFFITAFTNCLTLFIMVFAWKQLKDKNTEFIKANRKQRWQRLALGFSLVILLVPILNTMLKHESISDDLVLAAGVLMAFVIIYFAIKQPALARKKFFVFLILLLMAQIFWVIYQLAPMALTLFAQYNVDRQVFGFTIAPGWIQNINSVTIILAGPVLVYAIKKLQLRGKEFNIPAKYSVGLALAAAGLLVLPIGIYFANPDTGYVAFGWVFICYVLEALAEVFIGPIGYAMVGKFVPSKYQSQMMGVVLLNSGVAAVLASFFSNYALGKQDSTKPWITNSHYSHAFLQLGIVTAIVAVVLLLLLPVFKRWLRVE